MTGTMRVKFEDALMHCCGHDKIHLIQFKRLHLVTVDARNHCFQRRIQKLVKHLRWNEKLHLRCLTGFLIRFWFYGNVFR